MIDTASDMQVAFVVCSERSGSNLLRAMFDAHPAIHAPMPVHLGGTFARKLHRYGDLRDEAAWSHLIRDVRRQLESTKGKLDIELSDEELQAAPEERTFAALYRYIYLKSLRHHGKSTLAIKETHTHRDLGFYLACFPDAKFVMQVRDPRDYALSCMKAGRYFTHYGSVLRALDVWNEDQEGALRLVDTFGPRRVFSHKYETLVTSPETVLSGVCSFLNLPFDPAMLHYHERDAAQAAAETHPAYWGNLAKPVLSDNTCKYRSQLSRTTISVIERRTSRLMRQLGYAPENFRLGPFSRTAIMAYPVTTWGGLLKQRLRDMAKRLLKRKRIIGATSAPAPLRWSTEAPTATPDAAKPAVACSTVMAK